MKNLLIALVLLISILSVSATQPTSTCGLSFEPAWPAVNLFSIPVDLDYQNDFVYATTLTGQIYKFENSDSEENFPSVFFDLFDESIPSSVSFYTAIYDGGEDGLTSMVFHPNYPTVPKFYTFYSSSPTSIQVTAWSTVSGVVNYASADVLLNIPKAAALEARLGGDMQFDKNGNLFISVGDSSNSTASPDLNNLLGKILRITPRSTSTGYTIPNSNPYANNNLGKSEIYSRGYRNPRKLAFGKSDKLFVGDVGDVYDEINQVDKSNNHGWNLFDGCHCRASSCPSNSNQYSFPFYEFTSANSHAITLGVYYPKSNDDDDDSIDSLENRLLFADLYSGNVYSIQSSQTNSYCGTGATFVANAPAAISSFLRIGTEVFIADAFAVLSGSSYFYRLVAH